MSNVTPHKRLTARQLFLSCGLLFCFALAICLLFYSKRDEIRFRQLSQELFQEEMTSNTLSLHYTLASPEQFGIDDYAVLLPCYQVGSAPLQAEALQNTLNELLKIDPSKFDREERHAYDCLKNSLLASLRLSQFPYYDDPLSPAQGIQGKLPILLSEYEFRSRRDVEEYLSLLEQTGVFFESLLQYEREKAAAGTLPSLASLRKTEKQCDTIVTSEDLAKGTHFLQTSFQERLVQLSQDTPLQETELQAWLAENDRLLEQVFLPACQALGAGLKELEAYAPAETLGLSSLPLGKEYYQALLAHETGSSKTPKEVRLLLEQTLLQESMTIRQLAQDYPACLTALDSGNYLDIGIYDVTVMLEDLIRQMSDEFPVLSPMPKATLKTVSENLQASSAPAFYLTAPADNTERNVIYVNPKNDAQGLELYVTLAHEGYPGHLYQNAFSSAHLLSLKKEIGRLRLLLSTGGYLEGWALYVEQRSYDYASRLLQDQGRPADAVCVQLEKHNRSLQLCLYSLLDLLIHYDGASVQEIQAYLAPFGVRDKNVVNQIYEYVCQAPCNYPKYYLGYLEILELKRQAMELWGDQYSDLAFHRFLLEWGPADFASLKGMLQEEKCV